MTRAALENYINLKSELREETMRMRALERAQKMTQEIYGAYSLTGEPEREMRRRVDAIEKKRKSYTRQLRAVECWIDRIDDSQTRRVFRMRYIDGHSWASIGIKMHFADESGARHLHDRFLDRID